MALFSRGPRPDPDPSGSDPDVSKSGQGADEPARPGADAPSIDPVTDEVAPTVGISMSTFRGVGAEKPAAPPQRPRVRRPVAAEAPPTETVAGVLDNALLRQALAGMTDEPDALQVVNVARQLLQGHAFVRIKGDARSLVAEGKNLPLAVATHNDAHFVLLYSGGSGLQDSIRADHDADTSAIGQPALAIIRHVLSGPYSGVIFDPASGSSRAALPRDLLQRALDEVDLELTVKTLLAAERTDETAAAVAAALATAPLWVAAARTSEDGPVGIAETRTADGERYIELFSHPLEVLVLGRGDRPVKVTSAQLRAALVADEALSGVLVDPAGPWIRLTRDDLAPVLAPGDASEG